MYSRVAPPPGIEKGLEGVLAYNGGGDPVEWIPEATQLREQLAAAMDAGDAPAMINSVPEPEGPFAGYHHVKIYFRDPSQTGGLVVRNVYATSEQAQRRRFTIPLEGLFTTDTTDEG